MAVKNAASKKANVPTVLIRVWNDVEPEDPAVGIYSYNVEAMMPKALKARGYANRLLVEDACRLFESVTNITLKGGEERFYRLQQVRKRAR